MSLGDKQRLFTRLVGVLIAWAYANGYELTCGEAWRSAHEAQWDADQGKGIARSLHTIRLAQDFNLFKDGVYLTDSESYRPLGDYWKTLDSQCCWGGDFSKPDGNHFSLTHDGVR